MRLTIVDDYDLLEGLQLFQQGRYPRHLLFGVDLLATSGIDLAFAEIGIPKKVRKHHPRARFALASLRTMSLAARTDVLYSTFTYGAVAAGWLRRCIGRPRRIVAIVHGLPNLVHRHPRLARYLFMGHDVLAFLSPRDMRAIEAFLPKNTQAIWVPWGPEEGWATQAEPTSIRALLPDSALTAPFALAVGKSRRDFDTIMKAQAERPFPLVVVAGPECPLKDGPHVRVLRAGPVGPAVSLDQLKALYNACSVVILSLLEDSSLNGLTALSEGVTAGCVVVMSATASMSPFADVYADAVVAVPPQDAGALGREVCRMLDSRRPQRKLTTPTPSIEAFGRALLAALYG